MKKNAPDNTFLNSSGCSEEHDDLIQSEAMTRFELVKKSFADPWLRPLTHIARINIRKEPEDLQVSITLYIIINSKHIP